MTPLVEEVAERPLTCHGFPTEAAEPCKKTIDKADADVLESF
jgi:hypothetical protein